MNHNSETIHSPRRAVRLRPQRCQGLISAFTGEVKSGQNHFSGNATYQDLAERIVYREHIYRLC